jgi:ferritin-like metal-binding protein YciE
MAINSAKELFMHDMGDIYSAEQMILQILPQLMKESNNQQASDAYQLHLQQTQHQIQNLEQCFQMLGGQPPQVQCHTVVGLKQEHDSFVQEKPDQNVLTMFDLGAADKTEHYEIASYKGLIAKAQLMGQQNCVNLLQENLQEEESMSQRVEQIARQLGQQEAQKEMGTASL